MAKTNERSQFEGSCVLPMLYVSRGKICIERDKPKLLTFQASKQFGCVDVDSRDCFKQEALSYELFQEKLDHQKRKR